MEAQLANVMARLDAPAAVGDRVLAMTDAQRQQLQDALASALDGLRAEVAAVRQQVMDAQRQQLQDALASERHGLRAEMAAVQQRAMDAQRQQLQDALASALDGLRAEMAAVQPRAMDTQRQQLHDALAGALDGLRAEMTAVQQRVMDTQRQQLHDALASAVDGLRAEMTAVQQRAQEQAAAVQERAEDLAAAVAGRLEALHRTLEQALDDVARRFQVLTASADAGASRQQAFEESVSQSLAEAQAATRELARSHGALEQTIAELASRVDTPAGGDLAEGLGHLRAVVSSLEQRMEEHAVAVAALVEDQRPELERVLHEAIGEAVARLDEPLRELTTARAKAEGRLQELTASAEAGASRLRDLEEKVLRSLELPPFETPPPGPGRGQLVASLERQLREAEERIARR